MRSIATPPLLSVDFAVWIGQGPHTTLGGGTTSAKKMNNFVVSTAMMLGGGRPLLPLLPSPALVSKVVLT